jgi:Cu+-exporting ATPase
MPQDVGHDQWAVIRIEGMHCHRCEQTIQKALTAFPGVHEAEVDFNSRQASVLYDPTRISIKPMIDAINSAGYRATGYTQTHADRHSPA